MVVTSYSVACCIYIPGKLGIFFILCVHFMMSANSRIRFGLQIVFVCLPIIPSHYHHCANLSWRHFTHWGRVTHIYVFNLTIVGSDDGLSPGRCQAIIWTNAGILLIGPLGTNFSEILIGIQTFWFKKMLLKMSSAKWRPFCLGLNVFTYKKPVRYILSHVWVRLSIFSQLSVIQYMGLRVFSLPISIVMIERI